MGQVPSKVTQPSWPNQSTVKRIQRFVVDQAGVPPAVLENSTATRKLYPDGTLLENVWLNGSGAAITTEQITEWLETQPIAK
jgi:hypothetical protein